MNVPEICIEWIKLQRSGYKDIRQEFIENIEKEYELMKPYLPDKAELILDIGCGVGGIDVYIYNHYDVPHMFLMDSELVSREPIYGFDRGVSYYNSFDATKALMMANDVYNFSLLNLDIRIDTIKNIDLIISILSWGYHYPIDKYIKQVDTALSENGTLIIDIREGTDGIREIKKYFPVVDIISNYNKSHRICVRRK
jgi:SAM-dependent methyltransferase